MKFKTTSDNCTSCLDESGAAVAEITKRGMYYEVSNFKTKREYCTLKSAKTYAETITQTN